MKKYFATTRLSCGLKKTFEVGEEVPCTEQHGEKLLAEGHVRVEHHEGEVTQQPAPSPELESPQAPESEAAAEESKAKGKRKAK